MDIIRFYFATKTIEYIQLIHTKLKLTQINILFNENPR